MLDGRWRERVDKRTMPVGRRLVAMGITADVLTVLGVVFAVATAFIIGSGRLLLGIPFLFLTGFPDLFDGPVAKAAGTSSTRGAFFDSVTDRISDAFLMAGVAWYLISVDEKYFVLLPFAVLAASSVVSYERAKAEALGIEGARGGIMERAERMILLGAGLLEPWLLLPVLWIMLGLTVATGIGRFQRVWAAADGPEIERRSRNLRGAWGTRSSGSMPEGGGRPRRQWSWRDGREERVERIGRENRDGRASTFGFGFGQRDDDAADRRRARRQEALVNRNGRARRARREMRAKSARSDDSTRSGRPGDGTTGSSHLHPNP